MTFQAQPEPASASWRVLVALRLLVLPLSTTSDSTTTIAEKLEPWYDLLSGEADIISESNESGVKEEIRKICHQLLVESDEGIKKCEELKSEWADMVDQVEIRSCWSMIVAIWVNEKETIEAVLNNL